MERFQIINIFRTLGRIKLNKITDKPTRNALISDHLKMFKIVKENDDYIASLRQQFDQDAVKEINEAYQRYAEEEVALELEKIDKMTLADAIAAGGVDFSLDEFAALEPLYAE